MSSALMQCQLAHPIEMNMERSAADLCRKLLILDARLPPGPATAALKSAPPASGLRLALTAAARIHGARAWTGT